MITRLIDTQNAHSVMNTLMGLGVYPPEIEELFEGVVDQAKNNLAHYINIEQIGGGQYKEQFLADLESAVHNLRLIRNY